MGRWEKKGGKKEEDKEEGTQADNLKRRLLPEAPECLPLVSLD